ncbi:MAG: ATP-binding cassette domain-containing protein [Desulfobacterales bacterium]|nr:ATP-binding cassette domain-containing protein [Desulfobacterales bacterium]MDD4072110.1 ATP-binding cassette domain-containing protein [Desulfobacterales bacterium]MDD4392747.1 ATP-binding cassette domain-containing protein [Desulfobacterales bacterium]
MNISEHSLITLEQVTVRVRNRMILSGTNWDIKTGQNWAVTGPNGSGKSSLVKAVAGRMPVVQGRILRHNGPSSIQSIGYVSFDLHRQLISSEDSMDHSRCFSGDLYSETTVKQLLLPTTSHIHIRQADVDNAVETMQIFPLLNRTIRALSTGEMRKVLIARELIKKPELLILDEPLDGLDVDSRKQLAVIIGELTANGMQLILVTHRPEEIIPAVTHMICVENCRVIAQGKKEHILKRHPVDSRSDCFNPIFLPYPASPSIPKPAGDDRRPPLLIRMIDVNVDYGDVRVLHAINWTVRSGENWTILGPNGAGKSTLLSLISGDHPQAYTNDIYLFGRKRGSGESIWDIKKHIGMISTEFQIRYRKRLRGIDVVMSGFFDSVGLYHKFSTEQEHTGRYWISLLEIEYLATRWFDQLSFGEQRMVLLARAMVKSPLLLILDEPCQGLDTIHRHHMSELINVIGQQSPTHILYVTHHPEEIPACTHCVLELKKTPQGSYTSEIRRLPTPTQAQTQTTPFYAPDSYRHDVGSPFG